MIHDDLKIFLPKFLSSESEKELFEGIKEFPENIDERIYTEYLKDSEVIFQGDGIKDLLVVNLPDTKIKPTPGMIISNTCDIDTSNKRLFGEQIVYTPIINLEKYKNILYENSKKGKKAINNHINSIKEQCVTQIFYLPKYKNLLNDSIVFFDRVCNYPNKLLSRKDLYSKRLFTLSDYGAYLFLLKLSIHFTRIKDNVDRRSMRL